MQSEIKALERFKKESGLSIQQAKIMLSEKLNKGLFAEVKTKNTILNIEDDKHVLRFKNLKVYL